MVAQGGLSPVVVQVRGHGLSDDWWKSRAEQSWGRHALVLEPYLANAGFDNASCIYHVWPRRWGTPSTTRLIGLGVDEGWSQPMNVYMVVTLHGCSG